MVIIKITLAFSNTLFGLICKADCSENVRLILIGRAEGACLSIFCCHSPNCGEFAVIRNELHYLNLANWPPPFFFSFLIFLSLGFYARHLRANYATLIFCGVGIAVVKIPFMVNQGGKSDFGRVGKAKKGPKVRKKTCDQTHKLYYAFLPGLWSAGNPSSAFVRRRHSSGSRSANMYLAHVMFQRRVSSSRFSISACERWA